MVQSTEPPWYVIHMPVVEPVTGGGVAGREAPPYIHDRRLLTLEDTVEFFNLVQGLKLTKQEKEDLVNFMRAL